jgi:hypothetical protein
MSANLSQNDASVLCALFDPESSLSNTVQIDREDGVSPKMIEIKTRERQALQPINKLQPSVEGAAQTVAMLSAIIEDEPSYAAVWANRAQARRLLVRDDELPSNPSLVAQIFADLRQAISLAAPKHTNNGISSDHAQVLASAHTHKGYLLLLASKSDANRQMLAEVETLQHLSTQDLEEAASRELAIGGRYGNETARSLAVKTNPYAKLCGSIVREALAKEISDFYQPQFNMAG